MERIHYIVGIIIFVILTAAASGNDQRTVALTLLGEARGEGRGGMYAVACVIQKRAAERRLTLAQVCLQPAQFSCWTDKAYMATMTRLYNANTEQAKYAKALADSMSKGGRLSQDFTGHANHYYSLDLKKPPYWTFKVIKKDGKQIKVPIKPTKKIGKHLFYRLSNYSVYERNGGVAIFWHDGTLDYHFPEGSATTTWTRIEDKVIVPESPTDKLVYQVADNNDLIGHAMHVVRNGKHYVRNNPNIQLTFKY